MLQIVEAAIPTTSPVAAKALQIVIQILSGFMAPPAPAPAPSGGKPAPAAAHHMFAMPPSAPHLPPESEWNVAGLTRWVQSQTGVTP